MGLASSELVIWVQANDATHLLYHVVVESKQRSASTCHVVVGTWELAVNFSFGYGLMMLYAPACHVVVETQNRGFASACHVVVRTWELAMNLSFGYG
jgi:hypothetical protein